MTLLERARNMIAALQWAGSQHYSYSEYTEGEESICPVCDADEPFTLTTQPVVGTHAADCELWKLLCDLNAALA